MWCPGPNKQKNEEPGAASKEGSRGHCQPNYGGVSSVTQVSVGSRKAAEPLRSEEGCRTRAQRQCFLHLAQSSAAQFLGVSFEGGAIHPRGSPLPQALRRMELWWAHVNPLEGPTRFALRRQRALGTGGPQVLGGARGTRGGDGGGGMLWPQIRALEVAVGWREAGGKKEAKYKNIWEKRSARPQRY